jgi:hypothetical protein
MQITTLSHFELEKKVFEVQKEHAKTSKKVSLTIDEGAWLQFHHRWEELE